MPQPELSQTLCGSHRQLHWKTLLAVPILLGFASPGLRLVAAESAAPSSGLAKVPLVHVGVNEYAIAASIDGHPVLLGVDTGAPLTCIDDAVYSRFVPADAAEQTQAKNIHLTHVNNQPAKAGWVKDLAAGPMHFGGGPVAVTNLHEVSGAKSSNYKIKVTAGFIGMDLLAKYGAVIDWSGHLIYFNTSAAGRAGMAQADLANGWTAIPLVFTNGRHLAVPCSLGGGSHLIIDTGASFTLIDKSNWPAGDPTQGQPRVNLSAIDGSLDASILYVQNWSIGAFPMQHTRVVVGKFPGIVNESTPDHGRVVGLLGGEWLRLCNAIIDIGSLKLYLKKQPSP